MAIHNQLFLYGQITELPQIIREKEREQARCSISTMAGQRIVDLKGTKSKTAKINHTKLPIVTGNPDLIKIMEEFSVGDIVFIKGNLITRNFVKSAICGKCKSPYKKQGVLTMVNPIHISIEKKGLSPKEGEEYLKSYQEVSNVATIIGTLCRNPEIAASGKSSMIVKFPLAVDRKYFIADDNPEIHTDYPFVQVYGKSMCEDVLKRCRTGTTVFIDGTVQFRKYKPMKFPCQNPECDAEIEWSDWTLDIVPYALEYLSHWRTDEEIVMDNEVQAKEALESIGLHRKEE